MRQYIHLTSNTTRKLCQFNHYQRCGDESREPGRLVWSGWRLRYYDGNVLDLAGDLSQCGWGVGGWFLVVMRGVTVWYRQGQRSALSVGLYDVRWGNLGGSWGGFDSTCLEWVGVVFVLFARLNQVIDSLWRCAFGGKRHRHQIYIQFGAYDDKVRIDHVARVKSSQRDVDNSISTREGGFFWIRTTPAFAHAAWETRGKNHA